MNGANMKAFLAQPLESPTHPVKPSLNHVWSWHGNFPNSTSTNEHLPNWPSILIPFVVGDNALGRLQLRG